MPSVNRLYQEFKAQGLEVVLISFRESGDLVKRTAAERGYTGPVLLDVTGDVTGRLYGVWGPPTAYLVDREGRLVGRLVGAKDWSGAAAHDLIRSFVAAPARRDPRARRAPPRAGADPPGRVGPSPSRSAPSPDR